MIELPDLLLSYGIALKKTGNEYSCLCYAHDDSNPSMSVYINGNNNWNAHCHACGAGGSVIKVYCDLAGLDFDNKQDVTAAYKALETGEYHSGKPFAVIHNETPLPKEKPERTMLVPPKDTPPPKMGWLEKDGIKWGEPHEVHIYRQPNGDPWYYEARWNLVNPETGEIKKECRCFSWGKRGVSAPAKWECSHHLPPRPLYGLDQVAAKSDAQVVVCEGPRKASAAQALLPMVPCVGWAGGANGWHKSDWSPLAGKACILWPDADDVGRAAMDELANHLLAIGCQVNMLATLDMPDGWDAADALAEGWDTDKTLAWAKAAKSDPIEPKEEKKTPEEIDDPADASIYDMEELPEEVEQTSPILSTLPDETYFTDDAGITWAEPGDIFHEVSAPRFRHDIMPPCLHAWIEDTAGVKGVDPAILAISSLVAAATCLHDDIKIQPEHNNPGWKEAARIWGAVVGNSGIKKSPAIGSAISRIKKIQLDLSAKAVDLEFEYKAKESLYETQHKEYIKLLSKNDPLASKPTRPEFPEIPRIYFEDVTVEKLSESLKASKRGCLVLRDELSGFFAFNQYKGGQGGDAAAWLEFYEGGPRYTDRINRGSTFTPNWGGCVLGGIQPSAMQKIVDALPEDGMLQRFIVINAKPGCEGNEKPYSKAANDRYHEILQQIYDTAPYPDPVMLSKDANDIRKEVTRNAFKLIRANLVSSGLCSHLAKYEGLFARLALTYHAIECADRRVHPQSCDVSGETAAMVQRLMNNYLLPHAVTFYLNLSAQSQIGHAIRKVGELCIIAKSGDIANRDIQRGWIGWRCIKPYDQEIVMQTLIDQGWILPHPNARLSTSGRPTRYLINPKLQSIHAARKVEELERRHIAIEMINKCREDAIGFHDA